MSAAHGSPRRRETAASIASILLLATCLPVAAQAPALRVKDFAASGVETAAVRPAAAGWLTHLPATVGIPNAQQRFVGAPLAGLVAAVLVGPGDSVRAGQSLARLLSPDLIGLRRDLAQVTAERERTQAALKRDEALLAEGLIPASRVEGARAADRQAAALLSEKRALLAMAGATSGSGGEFAIVSPIDGIVLEQKVKPGERVEAAAALFHVARLDPLLLDIALPASAARNLAVGATVRVPATGAQGRVIAIGRAVSSGQTVTVRAEMRSGLVGLDPGQQVEAEIESRVPAGTQGVWRVPSTAIVRLGKAEGDAAVFVERGDAFVVVPVRPVARSGTDEVVQGELHAGDRVVSHGASQLKGAIGRAEPAR